MRKSERVIISGAIAGSIHTPSMSPHLPITRQQIADQAVGPVVAGAAIIHLHTRILEDLAFAIATPDGARAMPDTRAETMSGSERYAWPKPAVLSWQRGT